MKVDVLPSIVGSGKKNLAAAGAAAVAEQNFKARVKEKVWEISGTGLRLD